MVKPPIEIKGDELHIVIDKYHIKATLRYIKHNNEWIRSQDSWQSFYQGIKPVLTENEVTAMLMSQRSEHALTRSLTPELLQHWQTEALAAMHRVQSSKTKWVK